MTDIAGRLEHHDRRSRQLTFGFAFAFVAFSVLFAVAQARGRSFDIWMIAQPMMFIGLAIHMVLQELGRPRLGIVVGYGLMFIPLLSMWVRLGVHLATDTPPFPGAAVGIFGLLISGALMVYLLARVRRRYRATQTAPPV